MEEMNEVSKTLNDHEQNEAALAQWWKEEAARHNELGRMMREQGDVAPMPSAEDAEAAAAVEAAPDWPGAEFEPETGEESS